MSNITKICILLCFAILSLHAQDAAEELKQIKEKIGKLKAEIAKNQGKIELLQEQVSEKKEELQQVKVSAANNSSQGDSELERKLDAAIGKQKQELAKADRLIGKLKAKLSSMNATANANTNTNTNTNTNANSDIDKQKQLAEQKRILEQQKLAEQKRLEREKQLADQKRLEQEKQLAEQKRLEQEKQLAEQKRLEREKQLAEQNSNNNNNSSSGGDVTLTPAQLAKIREIDAIKKLRTDFTKIVTPNKCGECHRNETQVWEKTPHNTTFDLMSKRPRAKDIFGNLGEKGSIKRSDRCMSCHFTQEEDRGKPKATFGVSCESCHGEGKDWIYIHNDRNVPKPERRKNAMSKGMNNPEDIYLIAQNCYQCHSVPDEELVNKGGHLAGSDNFEFVRWSQGMVRHNFVRANNAENAKTDSKRLRIMFVTGAMLDLEYALRGLANATQQGPYLVSMMKRVEIAYKRLIAVEQKAGGIKEVSELLTLFKKLNLKPGNKAQLEGGASLITLKAQEFTSNHDGSKLGSLDGVLPQESSYVWKPSRNE